MKFNNSGAIELRVDEAMSASGNPVLPSILNSTSHLNRSFSSWEVYLGSTPLHPIPTPGRLSSFKDKLASHHSTRWILFELGNLDCQASRTNSPAIIRIVYEIDPVRVGKSTW